MEKIARLINVVAIAMALMIAFSGVVAASRPACTTPGTETVNTVIQVSSRGMVTEEVRVNWDSSNEDLLNSTQAWASSLIGQIQAM
jgi:hypothetical protein